ncbi:putative topless-related protein 4-like [Forsythia ovata]|uniref:Topless-related protein 4-like n=1 Tax=Forsythia ovata TaxID=205694 RepID=A0ABD1TL55_9LAMI
MFASLPTYSNRSSSPLSTRPVNPNIRNSEFNTGARRSLSGNPFSKPSASLANEYTASVNRVMWSPDGTLFGVAYSKHIVHIYAYHGGDDLRNHLEIDAHGGNVSNLAFSNPNKQLCIITCGEDKAIKVWDAATGAKQYTFEGHEAPGRRVRVHNYVLEWVIYIVASSMSTNSVGERKVP